jgi:hypothetical protein
MTEDNVSSALDAFIATFKPDQQEPESHKGQFHREGALSTERHEKKIEENFAGSASRVKSSICENHGSTGSNIYNPLAFQHFSGASQGPVEPAEPSTALDRARLNREMRWHLDHGMRLPRDMCAGCRRPIAPGEAFLDLADDNRVHFPPGEHGSDCLIAWGECWRGAVRQVFTHFEHGPWGASLDLHPASQTAASAAVPTGQTRRQTGGRAFRVRILC